MTTRTPDSVPARCHQRLTKHYGQQVEGWLRTAPSLLRAAADRWRLVLGGYHDAGHASVLATAGAPDGRPLLLKAWPDPDRFHREVRALRLWDGGPAVRVFAVADDLAVAALETVSGRPGGARRPEPETMLVAAALRQLHDQGSRRAGGEFPSLTDYLHREVLPRIRRRAQTPHAGRWRPLVDEELRTLGALRERRDRTTVLHADLYRENVPFDREGRPVLIDPLPMVGDAAFDWAFWVIYYDLGQATRERLAAAARTSGIPVAEITPWCRTLSLDGFLYYLETGDTRSARMAEVLSSLPPAGTR